MTFELEHRLFLGFLYTPEFYGWGSSHSDTHSYSPVGPYFSNLEIESPTLHHSLHYHSKYVHCTCTSLRWGMLNLSKIQRALAFVDIPTLCTVVLVNMQLLLYSLASLLHSPLAIEASTVRMYTLYAHTHTIYKHAHYMQPILCPQPRFTSVLPPASSRIALSTSDRVRS